MQEERQKAACAANAIEADLTDAEAHDIAMGYLGLKWWTLNEKGKEVEVSVMEVCATTHSVIKGCDSVVSKYGYNMPSSHRYQSCRK